jgi:hypothetical protein
MGSWRNERSGAEAAKMRIFGGKQKKRGEEKKEGLLIVIISVWREYTIRYSPS